MYWKCAASYSHNSASVKHINSTPVSTIANCVLFLANINLIQIYEAKRGRGGRLTTLKVTLPLLICRPSASGSL